MPKHTFIVTVTCDTLEEAETVVGERLGFDEDYGFAYTLDFEHDKGDETITGELEMQRRQLRSLIPTAYLTNVSRDQLRDMTGTPGEEP